MRHARGPSARWGRLVTAKPHILVCIALQPIHRAALAERYAVHDMPGGPPLEDAMPDGASDVTAVVTNGSAGLSAAAMARLPRLALIICYGAGYEHVDLMAARGAGIAVTHAPGVNDATVADHALAMMLALARGLVPLDRAVRAGHWSTSRSPRPTLNGRRVGILGLGQIGSRIATRAAAFETTVAYHSRTPSPTAPWLHVPRLVDLACTSDFLVVACPGGADTRHLVDAHVLDALGAEGFLINVARGSVVDTVALLGALRRGAIAGAALDVVEGEPDVPRELLALDNVILTPHVAGRSPDVVQAQLALCLANLDALFAGRPLTSRVA